MHASRSPMRFILLVLFGFVFVILGFLAMRDVAPPSQTVTKIIEHEALK